VSLLMLSANLLPPVRGRCAMLSLRVDCVRTARIMRDVLRPLVRGPGRLGAWLAAWLIMDDSAATA
jgi:hypothetical protein